MNDSHAGLLAGIDNPGFNSTCFDNTGYDNNGYNDPDIDLDTSYENDTTEEQREGVLDEQIDTREQILDKVEDQNISRNLLLRSIGDEVLI